MISSTGGDTHAAILAVLLVVLSACGSAGDGQTVDDDGPRVADAQFDGDFVISDLMLQGEPVPLAAVASLNIETEFGGLVVEPGCNTYYGSFTLTDDGTASFSVAGGTNRTCDGLEQQDLPVIRALTGVSMWSDLGDGFVLEGPAGDAVTLSPSP